MDISDEDAVEAAFAEIEAAGWAPDVVVANAGVQLFGQDAQAADLDLDVWRRTIDINLTGTFLTVEARRPLDAARSGGGSIILTGSPTGLNGEGKDFTAYSASKAGIHGLARTVAAAYADRGIRVNTVVPGVHRDDARVRRSRPTPKRARRSSAASRSGARGPLTTSRASWCTSPARTERSPQVRCSPSTADDDDLTAMPTHLARTVA